MGEDAAPRSLSQRRKVRKWIVVAGIVGIVLVVTIAVLLGVLVMNQLQDRRDSAASQEDINEIERSAGNRPVVSTKNVNGTLTATSEANSPQPRSPPTKRPASKPAQVEKETDAPPTMQPLVSMEVLPTADPTELIGVVLPANITTSSPTIAPTSRPVVAITAAPVDNVIAPTLAPAQRELTAFPTSAATEREVTESPTRPPFLHAPVPASNPLITTFYVHGDIPYNDSQAVVLEDQMRNVPEDAEFVVFVGDMRSAAPDKVCVKEEYEEIGAVFRLSRAPVFSLMGDNDWSDCPNQDEGLQLWRDEFVGFEGKYWTHPFTIKRQEGYPDNFAFEHKGTLFIGLNIIGGDVHDATEWRVRLEAESEWAIGLIQTYHNARSTVGRVVIFAHANPNERHNRFFQPLRTFISDVLLNELPIAYICGDKHEWFYEPDYYDQPSWLRIMVTGLGEEPLLKVTIESTGLYDDPVNAFEIDRRLRRKRKP